MKTLHNKELCFVIQESDVRQNGGLRKGYVVHIGRSAPQGHPIALACGEGLAPRYVYPFLPLVALGVPQPTCYRCEKRLREFTITGDEGELWMAQ